MSRILAAYMERCVGVGSDADGWREGCDVCLRRLSPPVDASRVWRMTPPAIIAFECEALLVDDDALSATVWHVPADGQQGGAA